ncbi:MAG: lipopolysaccharide biosynthesis protein [Phyllobacterium sp.]
MAATLNRLLKDNIDVIRDYFSVISGSAGRIVISLAYFVALANTLSIGDFGVFATASATGVVLSRLVSFGFVSPLYRIATVKPHLIGAYTAGYLLAVLISIPVLVLVASVIYSLFFSNDIGPVAFALIIAAEALLWRSLEVVVIVNNGMNRFGRGATLVIIGTILRALAAVLFAFSASRTLSDWAWWYAGANGLALAIAVPLFYPRVRLQLVPKLYWRRLRDSVSAAGAEMLFYIQTELDKLLVLAVSGATAAGIYAIVMRLLDLTALPIRSFNMMLVQKLMRSPGLLASRKIRLGLEGGVFLISTLAFVALAIFLHFFPTALGSNVAEVVVLLPLVALLPALRNLTEYQAELLYARGQTGIRIVNLAILACLKAALLSMLLLRFSEVQDWMVWLNAVFAILYAMSAGITYRCLRLPAKAA